jgi:integrase
MLPNEPTLHTKKGNWYLVFYDSSRRPTKKWVPLRTKTKRTARRRAKPLTARYMKGEFDPWTDDPEASTPSVAEAIDSYLSARKGDLSDRTWRTYKYDLEPLKEQFGDRRLDSLTPSEIELWCRRDDTSRRTVQKRLTELKTFYNYFVDREVIDTNPVEKLSAPRVEKDPPRYLSRDEYDALVSEIRSYVEAHGKEGEGPAQQQASRTWVLHGVQLAVHTGLRRGSLIALRWGDIDFEDGYVYVRAEDAKRDGHTVPLFDRTSAILEEIGPGDEDELVLTRDDGSAVPPRSFTRQFNRFAEMAGLPDEVSLHTCRDTFASWLVQAGVPIYKVSNWLGHSTVKVTERYAHLAPTESDDRAEEAFS